ncbi:MAG: EVE domain-containing protein [Gemmatimonadetes bacterium]|nr:EVE domain-containing protein [Gemmatimonadota bacterium]
MANAWLFKEEPTHYSFDDLSKDGRARWDGVRNNLALKHLRQVRKGDGILYYHTGSAKAIVGIARAVSDPYPDPKARDARYVVVDVEPVKGLRRPVTLAEIKAHPKFKNFPLVRIPRLSVMPVTEEQWDLIEEMARA